ncbi:hypothetical protein [Pseudopedobacter beijingensis]|uniref:PAC domain-containing protein n=1 Tax=Pseudopedobacter beijingensis TaxID=1207056 RepID=A0ABW4IAH9_9SPHI
MIATGYSLSIAVIIGGLILFIIIGLLGGWGERLDFLFSYLKQNSSLESESDMPNEELEIALEARVGSWEIYLPTGATEWTEEVFYIVNEQNQVDLKELIGFYVPFSARLFKEHYLSVIETGKPVDIDLKIYDPKTDREKWKRKRTYPIKDQNGKVIGIKGALRKISEK